MTIMNIDPLIKKYNSNQYKIDKAEYYQINQKWILLPYIESKWNYDKLVFNTITELNKFCADLKIPTVIQIKFYEESELFSNP